MSPEIVIIDVFEDERGELYEPVMGEDLLSGNVRNVHVITIMPGKVRGNHYHLRQTESICMGPNVAIHTIENGERKRYRSTGAGRVIVRVTPNIPHAIVNEGDDIEYVVCSSDVPHDPEEPDRIMQVVVTG
ncbi:MAG: hypothetical protein P9M00_00745 [Candidatus Tritonobacter lacicola]|nr:hypothetical protein [Candidatus Tritonobacter lacicola]